MVEFNTNITLEGNFMAECNPAVLNQLLGLDLANHDSSWNLGYCKFVQNRKHRKRRINKKWAKKYGYHEERFNLGNMKVEQIDSNTFSLTQEV